VKVDALDRHTCGIWYATFEVSTYQTPIWEILSLVQSSRKGLFIALALIVGGAAAFFLFLYLTGHDPDERPLSLFEWLLGGILIGPGFGYLIRWRNVRSR
jgi:hypothetical protein